MTASCIPPAHQQSPWWVVASAGSRFWEPSFTFGGQIADDCDIYCLLIMETLVCLGAQSCPTCCDPMDCSLPGSSVHGDSPGKNTGVVCHALLQGILPTQGSNPSLLQLLHWQANFPPLSYLGSPFLRQLLLFSYSIMSSSLQLHGLQNSRHPCPSPSLGVCSNSCPLHW